MGIRLTRAELEALVDGSAAKYGLDPDLVRAIVSTESSWDQWRTRYEPTFRYLNNPRDYASSLMISYDTEETLQKTSWSLMQVMGGLYRDLGGRDQITTLLIPEIGLDYGCRRLRDLFTRYHNEPEVIAAYNAGSAMKTPGGLFVNSLYVDRVHSFLIKLRSPV